MAAACWAANVFAFAAKVAVAPRNVLELTTEAIDSAKKSLHVNIYEMKSKEIGEAIVRQINAGLHVEILEEGQPVGGVSAQEKAVQTRILNAMAEARGRGTHDHYYVMTSKASKVKRRFRYDHAKYVVVDDNELLIGSENFSENAKPTPSKPGNRGWEALLHDPAIAKSFMKVFQSDIDMQSGDVMDLTEESDEDRTPQPLAEKLAELVYFPLLSDLARFTLPDNQTVDVSSVEAIFSPHSLSGLLQLMNGAEKTLQLELMTFAPRWGRQGDESPLLSAVEAAARRGVKVQVLLNDETAFSHGAGRDFVSEDKSRPRPDWHHGNGSSHPERTYGNVETCDELNRIADDENLDLEARIANLAEMKVAYIHNKGVLVDGHKVLVSSINWNQNSVENNREAGVVLDSPEVYSFYEPVFERDWSVSESRRHRHH